VNGREEKRRIKRKKIGIESEVLNLIGMVGIFIMFRLDQVS
jgi:hypothetical protein